MRASFIVLLSSAFLCFGCKRGIGDRCVQNSDCESGYCSSNGDPKGGACRSTTSTGTMPDASASTDSKGGAGGEGGSGGEGGQGASDAASDASDALPGG